MQQKGRYRRMKILIRGAGDLATGIASRLYGAGHQILMTEIAVPLTVRRTVALSRAVYEGRAQVEEMKGVLMKDQAGAEHPLEGAPPGAAVGQRPRQPGEGQPGGEACPLDDALVADVGDKGRVRRQHNVAGRCGGNRPPAPGRPWRTSVRPFWDRAPCGFRAARPGRRSCTGWSAPISARRTAPSTWSLSGGRRAPPRRRRSSPWPPTGGWTTCPP